MPSSLDTAVLRNTIDRAISSPDFPLSNHSLTGPLSSRLAQLSSSTGHLHFQAQKNLVAFWTSSSVGLSAGYASWMLHYADGATAGGVAGLIVVATLRWALSNWDKAKRRWMQNWQRTVDGLERDIEETFNSTLDKQVLRIPRTVSDDSLRSSAMLQRRVTELQDELNEIDVRRQ